MRKITKNLVVLFILALSMQLNAQDYKIYFAILDTDEVPDSVQVNNLEQSSNLTLQGSDVLHLINTGTSVNSAQLLERELHIYPNPMQQTTTIEFYNTQKGNVNISVVDVAGRKLAQNSSVLSEGNCVYKLSGLSMGTFIVNISTNSSRVSAIVLSKVETAQHPTIELLAVNEQSSSLKTASLLNSNLVEMQYNDGEELKFTAYFKSRTSEKELVPTSSQTITFAQDGAGSPVTDADGNIYNTVWIGNQLWMAGNLKVTTEADSTAIPLVTDNTEWKVLEDNDTDKAYCYYNNNASGEKDTYGALYTYAAAKDACPTGWHLPTDAEWTELEDYITADGHSGTALKSTSGWNSYNGTDNYGFSALPGGYRYLDGTFSRVGKYGTWWSSTDYDYVYAYYRRLSYSYLNVNRDYYNKSNGFSVRCLRD